MNRLIKYVFIFFVIVFFNEAHAVKIKFATLAPEGTAWVNLLRKMNSELEEKTNGKVKLKIYPGGVMGDENVVLQKIRAGQLHSAALTGIGLGQVESAERILEMPFLFKDYEEIDYVVSKISPKLEKLFLEKGYVVFGWAEAGLVNFFSKKPITSLQSLQEVKMWAWSIDPIVKIMFNEFNINSEPLELPDVTMSLDTGIINACYSTPLAALALQWAPRIKYITKQNMAYSSGALLISKNIYNQIPKQYQGTLIELGKKYAREITLATREENKNALDFFKKEGKEFVEFDAVQLNDIKNRSTNIRKKLVGKFFSKDFHNETIKLRNKFREEEISNLKAKIKTYKNDSNELKEAQRLLNRYELSHKSSKEDLI